MERHLHEDLHNLNGEILKMAALAEQAIRRSVDALKSRDKALAQAVIADDKTIDEMEIAIELKAIDLLACQQPMAGDLRFIITSGIKINGEIERIADLAVNIAQRALELADHPLLKPFIDIPKLTMLAGDMVRNAIDSFVKQDEELAKRVILSDAEVDELKNLIQEELINDYMVKDGKTAPRAVPLLLVARHLERICDHATNIAEEVIYMVKAKIVKHHPETLDKS